MRITRTDGRSAPIQELWKSASNVLSCEHCPPYHAVVRQPCSSLCKSANKEQRKLPPGHDCFWPVSQKNLVNGQSFKGMYLLYCGEEHWERGKGTRVDEVWVDVGDDDGAVVRMISAMAGKGRKECDTADTGLETVYSSQKESPKCLCTTCMTAPRVQVTWS